MTALLTTKWTCDRAGNWHQVPMILTRTSTGFTEAPAILIKETPNHVA